MDILWASKENIELIIDKIYGLHYIKFERKYYNKILLIMFKKKFLKSSKWSLPACEAEFIEYYKPHFSLSYCFSKYCFRKYLDNFEKKRWIELNVSKLENKWFKIFFIITKCLT